MPSVHDNHIVRYSVSAREQTIVIETENRDQPTAEFTNIIFKDVLAYFFEHDLFSDIIFDVTEMALEQFLKANEAMFEEGDRWGWPRGWESKKESIGDYVRRMGMRAFELSSSYGMSGWVLSKSMAKVANQAPDPTLASGTSPAGQESRPR